MYTSKDWNITTTVYDWIFSSTAIWAIWIWRSIARLNFILAMYFNDIKKLTIIGLDNGLLPERRQAIIWTNTGILLIAHWLGNKLQCNAFEDIVWEMVSIASRPQCVKETGSTAHDARERPAAGERPLRTGRWGTHLKRHSIDIEISAKSL